MSGIIDARLDAQIGSLQENIAHADQKAAFVLAAAAFLLGRQTEEISGIGVAALILGALTVLAAVAVVFPRTSSLKGETSWDDLVDLNEEAAAAIFGDDTTSRSIKKINSLARISKVKHRFVKVALVMLLLQLLCSGFDSYSAGSSNSETINEIASEEK